VVLQRTASAMGITSLTTAVAFLSCAISSIPPLRCFGIFLSFVIVANYLLVITWYPAAVFLWSRNYEKQVGLLNGCFCLLNGCFVPAQRLLCTCSTADLRNYEKQPGSSSEMDLGERLSTAASSDSDALELEDINTDAAATGSPGHPLRARRSPTLNNEDDDDDPSFNSEEGRPGAKHNAVVRFFGAFAQIISRSAVRRAVLVLFALLTAAAIHAAVALPAPVALPELFPDGDCIARFKKAKTVHFQSILMKTPLYAQAYYGVDDVATMAPLSGLAPIDTQQVGAQIVWDKALRLGSPAGQLALVGMCDALLGERSLQRGDMDCPMQKIRDRRVAAGMAWPVATEAELLLEATAAGTLPRKHSSDVDAVMYFEGGVLRLVSLSFKVMR